MLLFLVLSASLQTLRGTPLPPPLAGATADVSGVMIGGCPVAPDDGGQQLRSVFSILQSCLLTIFACVWTSAHPNINGPRDSWWTCIKRKVVTMLYAVIVPEVIFLWALNQRHAAKTIAEGYNEQFARAEETQVSLQRQVVGLFHPLPKKTTWRGDGQSWTRTHGFFIQMGGFILYDNGYPTEVLDYNRLKELLLNNAIDAPTVTECELEDRSKGDTISKAIVLLQTTWFVIQCIARAGQRLPLSELEVLTLAFAVMNAAIYGVWWNKPQGVDMAICVPLKGAEIRANDSTTSLMVEVPPHPQPDNLPQTGHCHSNDLASTPETSLMDEVPPHPEPDNLPQTDHCHSNNLASTPTTSLMDEVDVPPHPEPDNLPQTDHCRRSNALASTPPHEKQREESPGEQHSWLRRKLQDDRQQHSSLSFFLFHLPYRILISFLHPFDKMGEPKMGEPARFERNRLRVPKFYASNVNDAASIAKAASVFGIIFGAIHLLAWVSHFPSPRDLILWRVSATIMTLVPFLSLASLVTWRGKGIPGGSRIALLAVLIPFYVASRVILLSIALKAIHHPPHNVLLDIVWTTYIPHF